MKRHNDVCNRSGLSALSWFTAFSLQPSFSPLILIGILSLTTLACALVETSARSTSHIIIRNRLPTLTPTFQAAQVRLSASPLPATALSPAPASPLEAVPAQLPPTAAPVAVLPLPSPTFSQNMEPANAPPPEPTALALAIDTPTPLPTDTPAAPPTETPTPTPLPTETPTATPSPTPSAWLFSGVRTAPAPEGNGLLLYGDIINNTGSSQTLQFVSANFYDAQGQAIAPAGLTDYWPTEAIPPGGQIPFELNVTGVTGDANFVLTAEAVPSNQTPRQDFEFSDLDQSSEGGDYCLSGSLRDQGSELQEYLVIVAILYDPQNNVVNFSDHYESNPSEETDEHTLDFELCVNPLGQNVARHELRALGL